MPDDTPPASPPVAKRRRAPAVKPLTLDGLALIVNQRFDEVDGRLVKLESRDAGGGGGARRSEDLRVMIGEEVGKQLDAKLVPWTTWAAQEQADRPHVESMRVFVDGLMHTQAQRDADEATRIAEEAAERRRSRLFRRRVNKFLGTATPLLVVLIGITLGSNARIAGLLPPNVVGIISALCVIAFLGWSLYSYLFKADGDDDQKES